MSLLSDLSACDFGYISVGRFMDRTAKTLRTMDALERYRGHFYNWYDTQSLKPLLPMYVSSVDSGNLAASLLTLRAGLLALPDEKLLGRRLFDGLADTAMVLMDVAGERIPAELAQFTKDMESMRSSPPDETLWAVRQGLERLAMSAREVVRSFEAAPESEAAWWARSLAEQCQAAVDELTVFAPWARTAAPGADSLMSSPISGRSRRCASWPVSMMTCCPSSGKSGGCA